MEPVIAAVFIAAPFVLDFQSSTAKTLSIIFGVAVLLVGLTTQWRMSIVQLIPLRTHFGIDVGMGIVAILAPFVLGFSDESDATIFLIVMGVLELGAALATDWSPEAEVADPGTRVRMRPR
jgi:hypothetical protein